MSCFSQILQEVCKRLENELEITTQLVSGDTFSVTFKNKVKCTLHKFLNYIAIFYLLNVIAQDEEWIDFNDEIREKYIDALNIIDAPYFVRYLLKVNLLKGESSFNKFKNKLNTQVMQFTFGYLAEQRKRYVLSKVQEIASTNTTIIDVGCGENSPYAKHLGSATRQYICVDTNNDRLEKLKYKLNRDKPENIYVYYNNLTECLDEVAGSIIILGEVIEHMSVKDAKNMLDSIAERKPLAIIITTPNSDFNVYYGGDVDECRIDEHVQEFNERSIYDILTNVKCEVRLVELIGDCVTGNHPSIGVFLAQF